MSVTNIKESPAVGAAILAAVGAGQYENLSQATDEMVRVVRTYDPTMENVGIYDEYYATYRALYPVLRPLYAAQSEKVERLGRRTSKR